MRQESAVGGVEHARALDPVHGVGEPWPIIGGAGRDGDVADGVIVVDLDEVDRTDRAAGGADRARNLAQHSGALVDLDAQREAVLGAGGGGHWAKDLTARRRGRPLTGPQGHDPSKIP